MCEGLMNGWRMASRRSHCLILKTGSTRQRGRTRIMLDEKKPVSRLSIDRVGFVVSVSYQLGI